MIPTPILDSGTWLLLEAIFLIAWNPRKLTYTKIIIPVGQKLTLKSSLDSFDGDAAKCETLV